MRLETRELAILAGHALVGWALCGAIIAIGFAVTTVQATLIAHAVGAPIIFALITASYVHFFNFTSPRQTAIAFLGTVVFMDVLVVALLINGNLDMFTSILGTWLPFALIFAVSYLVGGLFAPKPRIRFRA